MSEINVTKSIDARGSYCPGPLMELIKGIKTSQIGDIVEVISSDKGSAVDIPVWVNKMGHEIASSESNGNEFKIAVRKAR